MVTHLITSLIIIMHILIKTMIYSEAYLLDLEFICVSILTNYFFPVQPKLEESQSNDINTKYMSSHPSGISKKKRAMIEEIITEEIGSYWRDLGRNLKVREGKIDEIDATNATVKSKVLKVLEIFDHNVDKPKWFYKLCEGLEQARRKDLSRSIQEIMTRNI